MKINWLSGVTPVSELTLENFESFASDFAPYAYSLCYKATFDEKQAINYSAGALAAVACKEAGKEGSEELMPKEAIGRVLLEVLNKQQLAQLNNDDIKTDRQADQRTIDAIVEKAVELTNANMPRYARVFSGTKGTLVILGIVAVIVAAIVLIWLNPNACNAVAQSGASGTTGEVDAAARPDTDMLINVLFDDSAAEQVNTGAHPVVFVVDGPDSRAVTSVSVINSQGVAQSAYPCGEYKYCFIATESDVYQTVIGSELGEMSAYYIVPPAASDSDVPDNQYYVVSHNDTALIALADSDILSILPSKGTVEETFGGYIYTPAGGEDCIGLDMIGYTDASGKLYKVPVLVSNSSPYIDPGCLRCEAAHTPTKAGMLAGRIISSDEDGDELTFALADTKGCSALISPDGSYIVLVEPEYRAEEASFSFTVTDGIIVSEPYTVSISLTNNLIEAREMNVGFVCFAGEDGYYNFELPAVDDDGDKLTWSLVTETVGGYTAQWGSEVIVEDDNVVLYRIDPELDEDFVEVLTFSCGDGWLNGTLMTVICTNRENLAPVSSGNNYAEVKAGSVNNILTVTVNDDCQFDKCVITAVGNVRGGQVAHNTGWSEMTFAFTPDGSEERCSVLVTVTDINSEKSVQIVYDIKVTD